MKGADKCAHEYALSRAIPVRPFPAKWTSLGRRAGPIRNAEMLRELTSWDGCVSLIAFPGGKGTADMVAKAKSAGVPVSS
jgi:hypothetical protein